MCSSELIRAVMNANDEHVEIQTHLRLGPNHNESGEIRFSNDSVEGVGANADAGLVVDMAFVASDPLSELVWSPRNGLSIRCTVGSVLEKTPTLLWGVGPSAVDLSSAPNAITGIKSDELVNAGDSLAQPLLRIGPLNHDVSEEAESWSNLHCNAGIAEASNVELGHVSVFHQNTEDIKTAGEVTVQGADKDVKNLRSELCACAGLKNELARQDLSSRSADSTLYVAPADLMEGDANDMEMGCPTAVGKDDSHDHQMSPKQFISLSESLALQQCEPPDPLTLYLPPPCSGQHEALGFQNENITKEKISPASISALPSEKVEATAEKDLLHFSENESENVNFLHQFCDEEKQLPLDLHVASEASPIWAYMSKGKRKEKALSAGSEHEDDSHESVESCNCGTFVSTGKKGNLGFEQQFICGSRNVKQKMEEHRGCSSFAGNGSSFLSWISNLINGFGKSNEDKAPSASPLLAKPDKGNEKQGLLACNITEDHLYCNIGFKSFFQSMYRLNHKKQGKKILQADKQIGEGCKLLKLPKIPSEGDCKPMAFGIDDSDADRGRLLLTEMVDHSDDNAATFQPDHHGDSGNRISSIQASDEANNGVGSSNTSRKSSLGKRKADSGADLSDTRSEVAKGCSIVGRNKLLGSLWVTRFSSRSSAHIANVAHGKQSTIRDVECSVDYRIGCSKVNENSRCEDYASEEPVRVSNKELQYGPIESEASPDQEKHEGRNINLILPSLRFKSSEAMASVFAKRLDALRQILPSDSMGKTAQPMITCLFCGSRGHHLRDCCHITEADLEELLRNASSYCGSETFPCLCIKCFQLNHWAIACPDISSRKPFGSGSHNYLLNGKISSTIQFARGSDRNLKVEENIENQPRSGGEHTSLDVDSSCRKHPSLITYPYQKMNVASSSRRRITMLNSNPVKKVSGPIHGFTEPELRKLTYPLDGVRLVSAVPEGIFEAVKKLRLSRSDVLKWVNSAVLSSKLIGYYLRVHLGKPEGRLAGTGYHVACITGESSGGTSKELICVNVGGMRCSIGSQCISNQDFLEDELIAWWSTTSKGGGGIPSEDYLRAKIEERTRLGL
ncbi:hypothetical protein Dimus_001160 [Dionaea muscipula]